jgi:hypothetical protein
MVLDRMFSDTSSNAMSQVITRLRKQQYLNSFTLCANQRYLRLGPAALKKGNGRRVSQTKALPPSQILIQLASLFYCCLGGVVRKRLKPRELARAYPHYPPQLRIQHPYYVDRDGKTHRLAMIVVESSANAQRILDKHMARIDRYRRDYPAIGPMLDQGDLMIVSLFPSAEVLTRFNELLAGHRWYPPSRTFHIPYLNDYLPQGI